MKTDILVVGAGITGITLAERFSSLGKQVLVIEKKNHVGGNCYDFINKDGILVQKYGPHIFHTDCEQVWDYLSKFTKWFYYQHKVSALVEGKHVTLPFNLNSIHDAFSPEIAESLEEELKKLGIGKKISILELKKNKNKKIRFLADFVYKNIFLPYTRKQWGVKPEDINPSVIERVPIEISRNDRYFKNKYQGIPKNGYTALFSEMLKSYNIKIMLKADLKEVKSKIKYDTMFYTGRIDEFFNFKFGKLDYRSLRINFKTLDKKSYQHTAVINYPALEYPFTRITEFKKMTNQKNRNKTTISFEYPGESGFVAWPLLNDKNKKILEKYQKEVKKLKRKKIYFVGRLAEYKYYDMDAAVKSALDIFNNFIL